MNSTPHEASGALTDTHRKSTCRILALDGGGAKGFYTLGILEELEQNLGAPLHECFELIYGTSTGSIIAALLARGDSAKGAHALYKECVPQIMKSDHPLDRTSALHAMARKVFGQTTVSDFKTYVGIVSTNWNDERPMIFKTSKSQAHGSQGSFVPFFGCAVADAIIASCSAYPFFNPHRVKKSNGDTVLLADGGFCANNPSLYAIADATGPLEYTQSAIRLISLGVGQYPEPSVWRKIGRIRGGLGLIKHAFNAEFLQRILGTNTTSMDVLRGILFKQVMTVRISDTFAEPQMATDLLEHDLEKLNRLVQKGRLSYQQYETQLKEMIMRRLE